MNDPGPDLIDEVAGSGLLDEAWYLRTHADVAAAGLSPLDHFVHHGMREHRAPNRYFDLARYARENTDITATELEPFLHYLRHGDLEGRKPHPLVDPAWYRRAYGLSATEHALSHYLRHRHSGTLAPGPALVAVTLMAAWRGPDAIDRYLEKMDRIAPGTTPDPGIVRDSGLLDPNHYLINASDVHEAGMDPVLHYCLYGWKENRHPNVYFDPEWYIATNPDLSSRPMNPVVHYVLVGEPAGRRPVVYFDPVWYRATYDVPDGMTSLGHYLLHRRSRIVSPNKLFDVGWYVARHGDTIGPNRDPFAHYLLAGVTGDIDPSPLFDVSAYRKRFLGRPSKRFGAMMSPNLYNPLVHFLRSEYR